MGCTCGPHAASDSIDPNDAATRAGQYGENIISQFFHGRITISILSRFFIFYIGSDYFTRNSKFRATVLLTNIKSQLIFGSWFHKMTNFLFMNY